MSAQSGLFNIFCGAFRGDFYAQMPKALGMGERQKQLAYNLTAGYLKCSVAFCLGIRKELTFKA